MLVNKTSTESYMKVEADACMSYMKVQADFVLSRIALLPSS
jgi:hypothetical protein